MLGQAAALLGDPHVKRRPCTANSLGLGHTESLVENVIEF